MSRTYHQDYIARIRYSNNLPPPPGPPKLLDVPGTGLGDGRYTSANYAARIIRDQPLNIEIDAELGMHIDLVGLPGVFDGDESSIYALSEQPPVHPHDAPLLRPANTLDKTTTTSGAKFLRRSEVLNSTENAARRNELIRRANANGTPARKRQRVDEPPVDKEDPVRIVGDTEKGFQLANLQAAGNTDPARKPTSGQLQLWNKAGHPENPNLTLLDAYPFLPDLHAVPDLGSYTVTKFRNNPMGGNQPQYDRRLDVAVIRPKDPPREKVDEYNDRVAQHELDPANNPPPGQPMFDYDLYLPDNRDEVEAIKAQVLEDAAENGSQQGEAESEPRQYGLIRQFETYQQAGDLNDPFGEAVAIALHDGNSGSRGEQAQGAYVYPIAQRTYIRGHRGHQQASKYAQPAEEPEKIHQIDLTLRRANEDELALRERAQDMYGVAAAEAVASTET